MMLKTPLKKRGVGGNGNFYSRFMGIFLIVLFQKTRKKANNKKIAPKEAKAVNDVKKADKKGKGQLALAVGVAVPVGLAALGGVTYVTWRKRRQSPKNTGEIQVRPSTHTVLV